MFLVTPTPPLGALEEGVRRERSRNLRRYGRPGRRHFELLAPNERGAPAPSPPPPAALADDELPPAPRTPRMPDAAELPPPSPAMELPPPSPALPPRPRTPLGLAAPPTPAAATPAPTPAPAPAGDSSSSSASSSDGEGDAPRGTSPRDLPGGAPRRRWPLGGLASEFHTLTQPFFYSVSHIELHHRRPEAAERSVRLRRRAFHKGHPSHTRLPWDEGASEALGVGSFGRVLAMGESLVAKVASVSSAPPDLNKFAQQAPGMLMDEALTAMRLRHPNLVSFVRSFMCHAPDTHDVRVVHLMERMAGDLGRTELPSREALRCAERDCLRGLAHMHGHGYLHRDIKPSNLLWRPAARPPVNMVFKLADLGAVSNSPNQVVSGTPQYLAPECIAAAVQLAAGDVWALYASLWELHCRRVPMLAVFPDDGQPRGPLENLRRWDALNRDAAAMNRHVRDTLFRFWGASGNPVENYLLRRQGVLEADLVRVLGEPRWDALLRAHREDNRLDFSRGPVPGFVGRLRRVLLTEPQRRPSVAELLSDSEWFAGVPDTPTEPQGTAPLRLDALPQGVAVGTHSSVWYAEPAPASSPDAFAGRVSMGTQAVSEHSLPSPGVFELFAPTLQPSRTQKPPRDVGPEQLVAAGNQYVLSAWEGNSTLLSLTVPTGPEADFTKSAVSFCTELTALAGRSGRVVPVTEFFVEVLGGAHVLHLVLRGKWRHVGARHYGGAALPDLTRALVGLHQLFGPEGTIAGNFFLNSLWVTDTSPLPRVNPATMYYDAIGRDSLTDAMVGAAESLRAKSRPFTPSTAWATLERYQPDEAFRAQWQRLFATADWPEVRAATAARLGEPVAEAPVSASEMNTSRHRPCLRLPTHNTHV